eukprot:8997178-Alexandrium_andersonii.AAC.1
MGVGAGPEGKAGRNPKAATWGLWTTLSEGNWDAPSWPSALETAGVSEGWGGGWCKGCLLYTSPSPRD